MGYTYNQWRSQGGLWELEAPPLFVIQTYLSYTEVSRRHQHNSPALALIIGCGQCLRASLHAHAVRRRATSGPSPAVYGYVTSYTAGASMHRVPRTGGGMMMGRVGSSLVPRPVPSARRRIDFYVKVV